MYGHVIVPLCLPSVMQSLLFSNKMSFNLFTVYTSSKQSECYIKCYCTITNHSYSSIWLPSNQFTRFFMNSLLRFAMVIELVNDILQNIWLYDTDCNLVNMSKTLLL